MCYLDDHVVRVRAAAQLHEPIAAAAAPRRALLQYREPLGFGAKQHYGLHQARGVVLQRHFAVLSLEEGPREEMRTCEDRIDNQREQNKNQEDMF